MLIKNAAAGFFFGKSPSSGKNEEENDGLYPTYLASASGAAHGL